MFIVQYSHSIFQNLFYFQGAWREVKHSQFTDGEFWNRFTNWKKKNILNTKEKNIELHHFLCHSADWPNTLKPIPQSDKQISFLVLEQTPSITLHLCLNVAIEINGFRITQSNQVYLLIQWILIHSSITFQCTMQCALIWVQ